MTIFAKSKFFLLVGTFLAVAVLSSTSSPRSEQPDEVYSFAIHLMRDGLFEAAAQQFLKFATENPTDPRAPDALHRASDCLSQTGSVDEAVKVLETLIETYPEGADLCRAKVRLGRLYYRLRRYEDAENLYNDVLALMPDCRLYADALLGRGEALIPLERYDEAAELFSAIIRNHGESRVAARARFNLAFCQRQAGREKAAIETYEALSSAFPKDPLAGFASIEAARLLAALGDSLASLRRYESARQFKEKVIFVPATLEGAEVLEGTGEPRRALAWYIELVGLSDFGESGVEPSDVYVGATRSAFKSGDYEAVLQFSNQFAERFDQSFSPELIYYRALAEKARSQFRQAIEHAGLLETQAAGSRWAMEAPRIRGETLLEWGKPREAVGELRRFVTSAVDSAVKCEALERIAQVYMTSLCDTNAALNVLIEKLDVEDRRIPSDILRVAAAFESTRRYGEAVALYEEIIEEHPLAPEVESARTHLMFIREFTYIDPSEALASFREAAREIASMESQEAHLHLAEAVLEIEKNPSGALEILSTLNRSGGDPKLLPRVLYLEGASHAKIARGEHLLGREKASRRSLQQAMKRWAELIEEHRSSEWAARAVAERILLRRFVEGVVDTAEVFRVLAGHPKLQARSSLLELLGDYYCDLDARDASKRALLYYQQALVHSQAADPAPLKLKVAEAFYEEGLDREALEGYRELLGNEQKGIHMKAAYGAGKVLRRMKRYEQAIPHFLDVADLDAGGRFGAKGLLQAADCHFLARDFERALAAYHRVERGNLEPGMRWELTYRVGLCQKLLGRLGEALRAMEACIASPHGGKLRARAFEYAVEIANELGDLPKERELIERWIEERQEEAGLSARQRLVRLLLVQGDGEAALELARSLSRAAANDSVGPESEVENTALLVMSLVSTGEHEEAQERLEYLEGTLDPGAPLLREIALQRARHHYGERDFKRAAAAVAGFAERCPGDEICEEGHYLYVMSLLSQDLIEAGTREARRFFERYPLSHFGPGLHLKLGNILSLKYQRHNEALIHFSEAAATAQDSSVAFEALKHTAVTYQTLSSWDEAERVWAKLLTRFPESPYAGEASLNVARCKMESGDFRGAIAAYGSALPRLGGENRARAYYWKGVCYQTLGDYQSAIVEYLKVPYLLPSEAIWAVTSQLKAAECYVSIRRYEAARSIYTQVIERFGAGSDWGRVARKGLAQIESEETEGREGGGEE